MLALKAYTFNCIQQHVFERIKTGWGWERRVAFTGNKTPRWIPPPPQLSIYLSHVSDSSLFTTRPCFYRYLILYNGQDRKVKVKCIWFYVRVEEFTATCRGGHFYLAQKILRYNPFTLHCFCCSALYYAPIPLSFHLSYSPPPFRLLPHHHPLKLQLSWFLSTVSPASDSG